MIRSEYRRGARLNKCILITFVRRKRIRTVYELLIKSTEVSDSTNGKKRFLTKSHILRDVLLAFKMLDQFSFPGVDLFVHKMRASADIRNQHICYFSCLKIFVFTILELISSLGIFDLRGFSQGKVCG